LYNFKVWVRHATVKIKIWLNIDLKLNEGNPSNPNWLLDSLIAYCEPKPTNKPAIINLKPEVFSAYLNESKGSKFVKCSW
jgi:hypothetical protein